MPALTTSFWPRDESVELIDHTVGSLLELRAQTHSDVLALIGNEHGTGSSVRLTYADVHLRAQRIATAIADLTQPGDFVALWAPNVVEWPLIQYAAALAGVVLVALNPVLREAELRYALTHSRAKVLIHADRSRDYDMASVATAVAARCPDLQAVISLSDHDRWEAAAPSATVSERAPTDPDQPVMLQFTSGTTGNPKGVLLRHRSLVNVAKLTLESVGAPTEAVAINPLPMFHTAGCVISTLGPLWTGGTMVLIETFDPQAVLDTLRDEGAAILFFVPAVLAALIATQAQSSDPAPRLTTILGGASTVSGALIQGAEQTFGASVINVFGQTELAPVLTATRPTDSREMQLTTVGQPLPQVDCAILDPATGEVQPLGVSGEICARGYQLMTGYLDDPDATDAAIDADGFLHTGDLGAMDSDGYLTLTGRLKELIIRGGENISPAEIEACLLDHPEVAAVAVVGLPDDRLGEIVAAIVCAAMPAAPGLPDRLTAHCRDRLSPHKVPTSWHHIGELPTTATGKVQKFRLVELVSTGAVPALH